MAFLNSGKKGKRAGDVTSVLSTGEHFNQQNFLIPTITGYTVAGDSDYEADDLAVDTAGGQVITLTGSGFKSGAQVIVGGTTIGSVTVTNTAISFDAPSKTGGTYTVYVTNPGGGTAVLTPGILYSGTPTWSSPAAGAELGPYYETTDYLDSFVATNPDNGSSPIVYSLYDGAFPIGATLDSNAGTLSGTAPVDGGSTTYSFTIKATDSDLQDTLRSFTLTVNTDVVTWSAPDTSQTLSVNSAITPLTLSASSAAGYGVSYAADSLPTGLTLADDSISGTPTVVGSQYTTLTATAATTSRTATRTIAWSIQVAADTYFKNVTALLQADNDIYLADVSSSQHLLTENGDVKPTSFSPYKGSYYSGYFPASSAYLTYAPGGTDAFGTSDFTVECWFHPGQTSAVNISMASASTNTWQLLTYNNQLYWQESGSNLGGGHGTVNQNTWSHFAVSRSSGTIKMFIDGTEVYSAVNTYNYSGTPSSRYIGPQANGTASCHISNFRIVNGTALYTSDFIPSIEPLTTTSQGATASEVELLTCQSNRFIDNSSNDFTLTVAGAPAVSGFIPFAADSSYADYGSAYFDGSDYFTAPASNDFVFGSGNFTIDAWVYPTTTGVERGIVNNWQTGGNFIFRLLNTNKLNILYYAGGTIQKTSTDSVPHNQWSHVVVERYNNNIYFYINGVADSGGAQSETGTISNTSKELRIGTSGDLGNKLTGYLTDLRIVKGSAVYQAAFSVPTTSLTAVTNTKLLTLQTNKPITNKTFIDKSSLSALITTTGDAYQGSFTPYSPFGYSAYFDGTGDYLVTPTPNDTTTFTQLNSSDFTIEAWVYLETTSGGEDGIVTLTHTSGSAGAQSISLFYDGSKFAFWVAGNGGKVQSTTSPVTNKWYHVALVREQSTNTNRLYIDGTFESSNQVTPTNNTGAVVGVGRLYNDNASYTWQGYISNLRISKTRYYTGNFNVPTLPFVPDENTLFLGCQDPYFIDRSPLKFSLTSYGTPYTKNFSPFAGHTITPDSHSVYFNAHTDTLSVESNTFDMSGEFTLEAWVYPTNTPSQNWGIFDARSSGGTNAYWIWYLKNVSGSLYVEMFAASGAGNVIRGATAVSLNEWTHVALTRNSSNTMTVWVNGSSDATASVSTNFTVSNSSAQIGSTKDAGDGTYETNGAISNLRFVTGSCLYTTAFTPSTSPLTAVSGTQLLTCQDSTLVDNSSNGLSITSNNNAQPQEFNPFGFTTTTGVEYDPDIHGGSVHLSTSGQYLSWPADTHYTISTGDFTYQCWLWPEGLGTQRAFIDLRGQSGSPRGPMFYTTSSNTLTWFNGSGTGGGGTLLGNQWNHVVLTRSGGTLRIYLNGIRTYSAANSDNYALNSSGTIYIGRQLGSTSNDFIGWISDVQVINDESLYTSNFIPPKRLIRHSKEILAVPFNDAAIYDAKARTNINVVGNTKVSNAVKKYGAGSMYFDGSGDGLLIEQQEAFGTGDFTIEAWFNTTISTGNSDFMGQLDSGTTLEPCLVRNLTTLYWQTNYGGTNLMNAAASGLFDGEWHHIAMVRYNGTSTVYLDGTSIMSASDSTNYNSVGDFGIGAIGATYGDYEGYIDDFRITKGVARYTSNFTVPSEAFLKK